MITREKVKAHLKRRKIEYIVGGITIQSLLFIYMGYRIGSFTSKQESVAPTVGVINASKHSRVIVNVIQGNDDVVNFGGYASKLVKCIETGEIFERVKDAAKSAGVEPAKMSKHINGHMDNVNGCHYRIVGLSTNT
jgi:hypothetical protein